MGHETRRCCGVGLLVVLALGLGSWAVPTCRAQSAGEESLPRVTPLVEPPGAEPAASPRDDAAQPANASGADPAAGEALTDRATVGKSSLLDLLRQANPMLWPLVLCSVVTIGFALERIIALRRARIMPRDFSERFLDRVSSGKIDRERAIELCRANDCVLGRVFGRIVSYWGQPTTALQDIADRELAGELQDLKRNVRVLNGTSTMAPLLGLLGTVVGMIEAFDSLSGNTGGIGKNEALAHGISLALMATAFGLVIAIGSVAVYYYLMNRIDAIGRSLEQDSSRLIDLVASDGAGAQLMEMRR